MNKKNFVRIVAVVCSLFILAHSSFAQGTAFTYQGQLTSGGHAANGSYDLAFSLYDAAVSGTQVGVTETNFATGVTNGLFTITLDFGSTPYNGQALWLQIAVSPAGSNTFTTLSPLQPLTSTPYAVQSLNAGTVTGPITLAQLPGTVLTNGAAGVSIAGTFSGDGSGLTNVNASQLTGTLNQAQLPTNVLTVTPGFYTQKYVFSSAVVTNVTVPAGATQMIAKLWGAGGGGGTYNGTVEGTGGGGAFVESTLPVVPGQTFTVVVGQHGDSQDNNAGGAGSGIAQGGNGSQYYGDGGQGGQASSLFYDTNGAYIIQAVAGGGGGASVGNGGAGGNSGTSGSDYNPGTGGGGGGSGLGGSGGSGYNAGYGGSGGSGDNYNTNAISSGIASLSLADGDGGSAGSGSSAGGGGGGYGGGGGGAGDACGGGGGSYGQNIIGGANNLAGNNSDPDYIASAGNGNSGNGNDGLVVIIFPGPGNVANIPGNVVGNGSGLTNLQTGSLVGTISNSLLQSDVALLDQSPVFTTQVTVTNGLRLNNSPIYLRAGTDINHGLAYAGTGITNFGTNQPDGPVLWGYTGGVLGTLSTGSAAAVLSWNSTGVTVNGALSASSLSGNGSGLTSLQASNLKGPIQTSNLIGPIQTSNLVGSIQASNLVGSIQTSNLVGALQASNLVGTISDALLPTNVLTSTNFPTIVISSAGVSNVTVPPGASQMVVKLWGAGGGGGVAADGGGGAFVETSLAVVSGQTFTVVVGQHGNYNNNNAGGTGSEDAQGGNIGNSSGQGGQASSLFYDANGSYIMQAVAGGGGGGGYFGQGGPGGNPGSNGVSYSGSGYEGSGGTNGTGGSGGTYASYPANPGTNYAANAATTGITSLALADGNGGNDNSTYQGGGGGGGYGGGGGATDESGGGGGGSYGQNIVGGTNNVAGNNSDPSYIASAGKGGGYEGSGNDGLVVIIFPGKVLNFSGAIVATSFTGNIQTTNLVGSIQTTNLVGSIQTSNLVGTISNSLLSSSVLTSTLISLQTNVISSAGISNITVPIGATQMVVKLWGAGGGGGYSTYGGNLMGGGGGFAESTLSVIPGQTYAVVVGQHGDYNNNNAAGVGSDDAQGGGDSAQSLSGGGQGGQASSLFYYANGAYVMQAVAGGGGGGAYSGYGGAGGNPGVNGVGTDGSGFGGVGGASGVGGSGGADGGYSGNPGTNYASNATTSGISSLASAGGSGGNASPTLFSGGGGGGYGGGGGGTYYGGGGGGGCYGQIMAAGTNTTPANNGDPSYIGSAGTGGNNGANGSDGLAVVIFSGQIATIPVPVMAPYFIGDFANCVVTNNAHAITPGASIDPNLFLRLFNGDTDGGYSNPNVVGIGFGQSSTRQAIVGGTYGYDYLDFYTDGVLTAPRMRIDAVGSVGIGTGTNSLSYPLQMGSGAYCSAAGVWTSVSDRNAKENFQTVDPQAVLAKVAALPITKWNYKVESNTVKHVGPMAQDFHSAFGLGDNDKAIGSVDEDGVALAAIQGLNQKLNEVNAQNAELKAQLEALRAEIKELEKKQSSAP